MDALYIGIGLAFFALAALLRWGLRSFEKREARGAVRAMIAKLPRRKTGAPSAE